MGVATGSMVQVCGNESEAGLWISRGLATRVNDIHQNFTPFPENCVEDISSGSDGERCRPPGSCRIAAVMVDDRVRTCRILCGGDVCRSAVVLRHQHPGTDRTVHRGLTADMLLI